jgi:cytochrome c553
LTVTKKIRRLPAVAAQLARQSEETVCFMHAPFEPETDPGSLAAANVALVDPLAAKGKEVYEKESCDSCHGEWGMGTADGPKLVGRTMKFFPEELAAII